MSTPLDPLAPEWAPVTLRLSGTDNFRSLKGMPTLGGRRIAGHSLLRSDQLYRLDAADWLLLGELGLKTVCDLRSLGERERYPNRLPEGGMQQLILEITSDVRADPGVMTMIKDDPSAANMQSMMVDIYRRFPAMIAPHLPALFELFDTGNVPVLIHCAAGKDRTGFAVALLLHALGVSTADIFADYVQSGRRFADLDTERQAAMSDGIFKLAQQPVSEAAMDAVLDARPVYLQAAFDSILASDGSIDNYLERHAGIDAERVLRLRECWLTPV